MLSLSLYNITSLAVCCMQLSSTAACRDSYGNTSNDGYCHKQNYPQRGGDSTNDDACIAKLLPLHIVIAGNTLQSYVQNITCHITMHVMIYITRSILYMYTIVYSVILYIIMHGQQKG